MSSDKSFVEYLVEQMADAGTISQRYMFGEYAIYCDSKVVALVCNDRLFIKPTEAGRVFIGDVVEAPAYPGAKPSFLIETAFEDRDWIGELVKITARELPIPKKKRAKKGG